METLAELMPPPAAAILRPVLAAGVPMLVGGLPGDVSLAFTTRMGGVSGDAFASLNLGLHTADHPRSVAENRGRLSAALAELSASPVELVSPRQVHGTRVAGTAEYRAEAGDRPFAERSGCDGLTLRPALDGGLAALLLFADCVPVVLASEVDVAVVHAGWRGLLAGVIQQAARSMIAPPGSAVIGPSIGPCCYQVSAEVAEGFTARYGGGLVGAGGRLDLWEASVRALAEVEVPPARVVNPRLCTADLPAYFYSYRRDGPRTGRQGVVAWRGSRQES